MAIVTTDFTKVDNGVQPGLFFYYDATILINTALSDAINLGRFSPVALALPSGWTAAKISFTISTDGTTFDKFLCDQANGEIVSAANNAANQYVVLDPSLFFGVMSFKIRSGTNSVPVTQDAARTIRVIVRGL